MAYISGLEAFSFRPCNFVEIINNNTILRKIKNHKKYQRKQKSRQNSNKWLYMVLEFARLTREKKTYHIFLKVVFFVLVITVFNTIYTIKYTNKHKHFWRILGLS